MEEPEVSVIVPTYNRLEVLAEVLEAIENQVGAPSFELVVVDDGSTDGTYEWLQGRHFSVPVQCVRQQNSGPAIARNRGVAISQGTLVAFLGDDTVPETDWLSRHVGAHRSRPGQEALAVIGYTHWHERMRVTAFLEYINEHGLQFGYSLIDDAEHVPFNFLYTSNLSMPRALLVQEPFSTDFPYAAWEDIELGYRLEKAGMRLVYESRARVAHDHPTDLSRFADRQEKAGYSAVVFYRLQPELGSFLGLSPKGPPPGLPAGRQRLRELVARVLQPFPVSLPRLWQELFRFHYIRGLQRGWQDGAKQKGELHET